MEKKDWREILAGFGLWNLVEDISDDGDGKGDELQLTKDGKLLVSEIEQEIEKAREEGDIASDFLYWHPLGGGMPDSSIRIGVEFEVGGCYEDWGFVIEQNGRTISSGRTLKEAISKLKDSK